MFNHLLVTEAERSAEETFFSWTGGPSPHLEWHELRCADGTPYPPEFIPRLVPLVVEFEFVRALLGGKPIRVNSAYRTEEWNRRVGGVKSSQHVQGRALDMKHRNPKKLLEACLFRYRNYHQSAIRGLGLYSWGVHMDTRLRDHLARWSA